MSVAPPPWSVNQADLAKPSQNIGLQARILSTRTFTIFVVMALLTTFATTPLATALYPPWYQEKLKAWRRGEIDWDTGEALTGPSNHEDEPKPNKSSVTDRIRRLLVYLTLDDLSPMLDLVSLFGVTSPAGSQGHPADQKAPAQNSDILATRAVRVHGLRLLQLTDRDSSVMTVSQVAEYSQLDPLVNIFRALGRLHRLAISGEVAVMREDRFVEALVSKSSAISSDLLLIPWGNNPQTHPTLPASTSTATETSYSTLIKPILLSPDHNIAVFFPKPIVSRGPPKLSRAYSFSDIQHDIPVVAPVANLAHHIYLPYFGGADDELALTVVLQLCEKADVSATVVYFDRAGGGGDAHLASATAKAGKTESVRFETVVAAGDVVEAALQRGTVEMQGERHHLVVLGRRTAVERDGIKGYQVGTGEVREGLGVLAAAFVEDGARGDLLVVQARRRA
jgi:hypothetical protein